MLPVSVGRSAARTLEGSKAAAWTSAALLVTGIATACRTPGEGAREFNARCQDGLRNGLETGVDCGGGCRPCEPGAACRAAIDCTTGICQDEVCALVPPACDDATWNGSESDVDCGGTCGACGIGGHCRVALDCLSGLCEGEFCVAPSTCGNAELSPGETDLDCGGPCRRCATGLKCVAPGDCLTATCVFGLCRDPSCSDRVRNQDESDTDCGGICPPCEDGDHCNAPSDCGSERCEGEACTSCVDGVQSGAETDRDCGGVCAACTLGQRCEGDGDCGAAVCEGSVCCAPNACRTCGPLPSETCNGRDDDCDGATDDTPLSDPAPLCPKQLGVCAGLRGTCRGTGGWTCTEADYMARAVGYEAVEAACDRLDNDCDGETDEGVLNACGACGLAPVEACNGRDDDCDGETDEGVLNRCGACGLEPYEQCNGVDDDCDGELDELVACDGCPRADSEPVEQRQPTWEVRIPPATAVAAVGDRLYYALATAGGGWVEEATMNAPLVRTGCAILPVLAAMGGSLGVFCGAPPGPNWRLESIDTLGSVAVERTGNLGGVPVGFQDVRLVPRGGGAVAFLADSDAAYMLDFDLGVPSEVTTAALGRPRLTPASWDATFDATGRRIAVWIAEDPGTGQAQLVWREDDRTPVAIAPMSVGATVGLSPAATGRVWLKSWRDGRYELRALENGGQAWDVVTPAIPDTWDVMAMHATAYGDVALVWLDETSRQVISLAWASPGGTWTTRGVRVITEDRWSAFPWIRSAIDAAGRPHVLYGLRYEQQVYPEELVHTMACSAWMTCTAGSACNPVGPNVDLPEH